MASAPHRWLLCTPLPSLLSSSSPLRHAPRPLALRLPPAAAAGRQPRHAVFPRRLGTPRLRPHYSASLTSSKDADDADTKSHEPASRSPSLASRTPPSQTRNPPPSKLHVQQPRNQNNADKRKYLLDVMSIRNPSLPTSSTPPAETTHAAGQEEVHVFEEWALRKLQQDGSSAEPVIQEMRTSWIQRLTQAPAMELLPDRSPSLEVPTKKDPLAGVAVRPVVVKRHTKVPEDWDGPGGAVVLIDKPQGWSSFAVCGKLRHMLGVKKVGHAGTLDPLSTGLLIVCVGKATKLADRYQAMTKVYSGTMRIGETTPSLDAGTPVSDKAPWEHIQEQDILSAVVISFLGDIMQVPPMYSAIKVKGERLYTKARRGEEIFVPPRAVKVYDFQLKRSSQNRQEWDFYIVCSKGTYIRSLCADLALSLGSCAYLTALRRERIGSLSVQDAWPIEELEIYYREILKAPFQACDETLFSRNFVYRNVEAALVGILRSTYDLVADKPLINKIRYDDCSDEAIEGLNTSFECYTFTKMNEIEVDRRIQQMVQFIRKDAEEKANEIAVITEEEFNIAKLQLVETEKNKIRADYDRKERLVTLRQTIEHSMQLNAQRLRYLQAQDDLLRRMREAAEKQLATISSQQGPYAKFLEALIIQGLLRLREPAVQIRCRKEDLHLVQAVVQSACEIYVSKANVTVPQVTVDKKAFLPGPPQPGVYGSTCLGGLTVATKYGHIVLDNTLDARIQIVFKQQLPEIRKRLFAIKPGQSCCFGADSSPSSPINNN